jgi:uncharacterized protein Veg
MKHLKGYTKRYFSLAIIAMYSSLFKLTRDDSNYVYHKKSWQFRDTLTSPPL